MNAAVVADFADIGVWPPFSVVKVDDTGTYAKSVFPSKGPFRPPRLSRL